MKASPFTFRSENNYEIMSRIDNDIYFEIELLCNGVKSMLSQLKYLYVDILVNSYMEQCTFLVEHVLNYIRNQQKTNLYFVKSADENTCNVYQQIHLREIEMSQATMRDMFRKFKKAGISLFPNDKYPESLFNLKAKMKFITIIMNDLFNLEKTKLRSQKTFATPDPLKFDGSIMN